MPKPKPKTEPRVHTLLEFALTKYLGEPTRVVGNGESHWNCPYCGATCGAFHTRPVSEHKDTFACWKCQKFGDIYDVVWLGHPDKGWKARQEVANDLLAEYQAAGYCPLEQTGPDVDVADGGDGDDESAGSAAPGASSSSPGTTGTQRPVWGSEEHVELMQRAWELMTLRQRHALRQVNDFLEGNGVTKAEGSVLLAMEAAAAEWWESLTYHHGVHYRHTTWWKEQVAARQEQLTPTEG